MGMFDVVECERPLPDGFVGEFQTKDLECTLSRYKISSGGRLLVEVREYIFVRGASSASSTHVRWDDVNFHGILNFYGGSSGEWHEYLAKFTDGQLVEIAQISQEPRQGDE